MVGSGACGLDSGCLVVLWYGWLFRVSCLKGDLMVMLFMLLFVDAYAIAYKGKDGCVGNITSAISFQWRVHNLSEASVLLWWKGRDVVHRS